MFENHDFDGVLNLETDLGADSTGEEPIDDALTALNSLRGSIRVRVPDGDYLLSEGSHTVTAPSNGIRVFEAEPDAYPTFLAPEEQVGLWLSFEVDGKFHGIDIDRTEPDISPEIQIRCKHRFEFSDVEMVGRESLSSNTQGNGVISVLGHSDSTTFIEDFRMREGTTTDVMGGSQPGIVIGPRNRGTVRLRRCDIRECSSHGVDASRSVGPVEIRGGRFENNNRSQIRFCGPGSSVEAATVIVDLYDSPIPTDEYVRTAGVMNEALTPKSEARPPSGGIVSESSIAVRSGPQDRLYAGYFGTALAGGMSLWGTDVVVDVDDVPAVMVDAPERILDDYPPQEPLGITLENCAFRGSAQSGWAVSVDDRPTSSLKNSCIAMPADRLGYDLPSSAEITGLNTRGRCTGPPR